ncbi:MAG: hypothetical protein HY290_25470 [Planctomycetia bacterium]|nr:hypothetical protein [Planctomycetia bacterium]
MATTTTADPVTAIDRLPRRRRWIPVSLTYREIWACAPGYQKFLVLVGSALLLFAGVHVAVLVTTGGTWHGDVSLRQPVVFGESFGLTCLSLAWISSYLPVSRVRGWRLLGTFGAAAVGETFLVSIQQWRGVTAFYNVSTPFDWMVFFLMGVLGVVVMFCIFFTTMWIFVSLRAPKSFTWAIRLGALLLASSQVLGAIMITNGLVQLTINRGGAPDLIGRAAALRLPHALTLHGLQLLMPLGWLLLHTDWSEARRTRIVVAAALACTWLVVIAFCQTFSGRAPLEPGTAIGVQLMICAAILTAAYLVTLIALARPRCARNAAGNS